MTQHAKSLGDNTSLYDAMAGIYDESIAAPSCRRIYDELCKTYVRELNLPRGARVVDVGCGTGRWAQWLIEGSYSVVGIEQAPKMIEQIKARALGSRFELVEQSMEHASIDLGGADLVMALGSLQYVDDPRQMIRRMTEWTRPGGTVLIMVDSLVALVLELLRTGRSDEAFERLSTRRGLFRFDGFDAALHLYDRATLETEMSEAGLSSLRFHGLAAGATAVGRPELARRIGENEALTMQHERLLADDPALVDCGLHLLAIGRKPSVSATGH